MGTVVLEELPLKRNDVDWRRTLDKVVPAVVVIRTTAPRAFDAESPGAYSATGFVVDKHRGIILTNRHVVKTGPVVAEAMFMNREEIPIYPIYRDPVHDFGFFLYDPSAIQFLSYEEIPLAPEAAYVGLDIRVVGNDSGEKVSIVASTLARLDREAPEYNRNGYNDFNTFYLQIFSGICHSSARVVAVMKPVAVAVISQRAASGTKGGSSGSPVIDCEGRAVALNAGGNIDTASAFFLPLERVVRALKYLQTGRVSSINDWEAVTIPRGTLQVTFLHKGFEETRRLGVRSETEQFVRHASPPAETGMLVVHSVVPDGPADSHLEPGDVLVWLNGKVTTQFLTMENVLDESVNSKVELQIERRGKPLTIELTVQDLHSVTPDHFLEISGAVIHSLSYQQARNFRLRCGLVYVAEQGFLLSKAGVPDHAIIKKFAGENISRLEDLLFALSRLTRGARVPLEYISLDDRFQTKSTLVTFDRHEWYGPPQIYTRNDSCGLWHVKPALPPNSPLLSSRLVNEVSSCYSEVTPLEKVHQCAGLEQMDSLNISGIPENEKNEEDGFEFPVLCKSLVEDPSFVDESIAGTTVGNVMEDKLKNLGDWQGIANGVVNTSGAERVVEPSLVMVEVHVPWSCWIDGVHAGHFSGTGVVIYHSPNLGLIAVDRNTVAISACDVMLSFAAYPVEIPGEVVFLHPTHNFALVSYDPSALGVGASLVRAAELLAEPALRRGDAVYLVGLSSTQQVTSRKSFIINSCDALAVRSSDDPRYRATNSELIELDADLGGIFTGVLADERGRVQAIWGSFSSVNSSSEDFFFLGGIPVYTISQILEKIVSGVDSPCLPIIGSRRPMPLIRMLEVELRPILLTKARSFGLSDAWIQVLMRKDPIRRQALRVKRSLAGSQAEKSLEQGDMVLAVNGKPVTCFRDIEDACQDIERPDCETGILKLTILRQGNEIEMDVETDVRDGKGTTRVINWCGGLLQDSHQAVRARGFLPEEGHGVYVSRWENGSPVERYGLGACRWIVQINGKPTPDLDSFLAVTEELEDAEFIHLKTIDLNGEPSVLTLKQDLHYWPTWELKFEPETAIWRRRIIKALPNGAE